MADQLTLKVNGQVYGGWLSAEVTRTLESLAATFSLGLTERWPDHPERWQVESGDACEIYIGADKVLTGWIDTAAYDVDDQSHVISMSGRGKTGDLVDCSAIHSSGSWSGGAIEQIAGQLTKPFGIKVLTEASTGAGFAASQVQPTGKDGQAKGRGGRIGRFSLQQGESVFETLDRLAKQRSVLLVENEDGDLEIRRPGGVASGYKLELGVNLKKVGFANDVKDRFSDYLIKGHPVGGSTGDFLLGSSSTPKYAPSAGAKDPGVTRYRPLLIINEDASSGASLPDRATWEAAIRAGKARKVTATVYGWRDPVDGLYRIDRLVDVKATLVGVDDRLLVSGVKFVLDAQGSRTELTLVPKEAFSLIDLPAPKAGKKKGKGVDALLSLQ